MLLSCGEHHQQGLSMSGQTSGKMETYGYLLERALNTQQPNISCENHAGLGDGMTVDTTKDGDVSAAPEISHAQSSEQLAENNARESRNNDSGIISQSDPKSLPMGVFGDVSVEAEAMTPTALFDLEALIAAEAIEMFGQ